MTPGELVQALISGAIVMGYGVCGLFFLRFWRTTHDRLFAVFSGAFWVLGIQRLALGLSEPMEEWRTGLYTVRLLGFLLILGAIIDKNRSKKDDPLPPSAASADQGPAAHL